MNMLKHIIIVTTLTFALTGCDGDDKVEIVKVPSDPIITEIDKPIPVITQISPDCELNKECNQFKILVNESNISLTLSLPTNVNARLQIDGGFREPIRDGDLITFNVSGFISPEMMLLISSNSEEGGNIWLDSYEYTNAQGDLTNEIINNPNSWYIDFYKVKVAEVLLNLFASNGKLIQDNEAYYLIGRETTNQMYVDYAHIYATSLTGNRYRFTNGLDGNQAKLLLPTGEYKVNISSGWYEDDYNVDFDRNFTLLVNSDNSIQQDIRLHPRIYEESTWNYLKDNFEGSLHKENLFNHYSTPCTIGNKYNEKSYIIEEASINIPLEMFCTKEYRPEVESIKVVSSIDTILTTNTGPIPLEANIERNVQLNLPVNEVYLQLINNTLGSHVFQILEVNYSNFGIIEPATMGDNIITSFSVIEKGKLILQNKTETTNFALQGESAELQRVCVETELTVGEYNLLVNNERILRYSDSDSNNTEHCYHYDNTNITWNYSYIELDFDSSNRQTDKVTFTSLSLKGNKSNQEISWKLED